ncbi:hypothetical protein [Leptothrix ochracea]|uniref:hypothetical protein n=1 Tax=Leptothrix ochracea TaxID=735331 RepID=UPI0034E2540E
MKLSPPLTLARSVLLAGALLAGLGSSGTVLAAAPKSLPTCQVIFDAGSSGTRLAVFVRKGRDWEEHLGPKVSALADPVREIRGRHHADMQAVNTEVANALDAIRHDGPKDDKGEPEWQGFDWASQCWVEGAQIFATAGMRLAEQEHPALSAALWSDVRQRLSDRLQDRLGRTVPVEARTLTGFEEGLYAWLAVRQERKGRSDFGIAEMGGASSQVTFPCKRCEASDDATRMVKVDGKSMRIYSYSFLGLGQDEAPHTLGVAPSCAYGAGVDHPGWKALDCASTLALQDATQSIVDPYNFEHGQRGSHRRIPTERADSPRWFLTGSFNYMNPNDVNTNCLGRGKYVGEEAVACFRPIYLQRYLQAMHIPVTAPRAASSWTLGAVICSANQCLRQSPPPLCRWSAQGCLQP